MAAIANSDEQIKKWGLDTQGKVIGSYLASGRETSLVPS